MSLPRRRCHSRTTRNQQHQPPPKILLSKTFTEHLGISNHLRKSVWKTILIRNHAEITQKKWFSKASLPTLPMTSTGPSQDAGKATLDFPVKVTFTSHLGAPKVHSTGDKTSTEECGHKRISQQIQKIPNPRISYWTVRFLVGQQWHLRITCESFHDQISFTQWLIANHCVRTALLGSHAQSSSLSSLSWCSGAEPLVLEKS